MAKKPDKTVTNFAAMSRSLAEVMRAAELPPGAKALMETQKSITEVMQAVKSPGLQAVIETQTRAAEHIKDAVKHANLDVLAPPLRLGISAPTVTATTTIRSTADVGRLVREARKAKKMSQQKFADLAGVGRRFISELENGKESLEFTKVVAVAAAAGIDLLARER